MGRKLYVGNLPYTTTEDELRDLFSQAGAVDTVNVVRDNATGRARSVDPVSVNRFIITAAILSSHVIPRWTAMVTWRPSSRRHCRLRAT